MRNVCVTQRVPPPTSASWACSLTYPVASGPEVAVHGAALPQRTSEPVHECGGGVATHQLWVNSAGGACGVLLGGLMHPQRCFL